MVDFTSGLPPLLTKLRSQLVHLLTLQTLECPQEGHSALISVMQGLQTIEVFSSFLFTLVLLGLAALKHTPHSAHFTLL